MKEAVLFMDSGAFRTLTKVAEQAIDRGYRNLLIFRPLQDKEKKILADYREEHGRELFDRVVETDRWDLETLRVHVESFETSWNIKGFATVAGLFNRDGILGAQVARLAEERGLASQSEEGLFRTNNKYLTRDALVHAGVPTVDFGLAVDEESLLAHAHRIGYPVILKPLNGAASQLVLKCQNDRELVEKFRMALRKLPHTTYQDMYACEHTYPDKKGKQIHFSPMNSMLVEGYIDGREASVEVVVADGKAIPLLVHDKVLVTEQERVVYEHLLMVPPVRFTEREIQAMKDYAVSVVQATGVDYSLCHVELRYGKNGPQLLEINPRVGGMMVTQSLKTMINFDPVKAMLDLSLGTFRLEEAPPSISEPHAMFTLYPYDSGRLEKVEGLEELERLPGMISSTLLFPEGSIIQGEDEEVFLIMCWVRGSSQEELWEIYEQAKATVRFQIGETEEAGVNN